MFQMNKSKVIVRLAKIIFLLPGNLKPTKYWFLSPWTLLSVFGLALTLVNAVLEFLNCPSLSFQYGDRNSTDTNSMAGILRPPPDSCVEQSPYGPEQAPDGQVPPSVIVDIVLTCQRIFTFSINVVVRILVLVSYPKIRSFVQCLNSSNKNRTYLNRQRWLRAWVKWSNDEQVFLVILIISVLERELDIIYSIYDSIRRQCSFFVVSGRILQEQSSAWFSVEMVIEIATLTLLSFVSTFVHLFDEVVKDGMGSPGQLQLAPDEDRSTKLLQKSLRIPRTLFRTQDSAIGHSSRCQLKDIGEPEDVLEMDLFFDTLDRSFQKSLEVKSISKVNRSIGAGEGIDEEIEGSIGLYFEMVDLWRYASGLTGFLTLIIFVELAMKFCLITFAGLAAASQFGLTDSRVLSGFTKGILIIAKMMCVTHLGQALPDSTQRLADKILKLRWESVKADSGLFKEASKTKRVVDGFSDLGFAESMLSQVISFISDHPLNLSALGYFQVSKSSLITVSGVIVTYLVILVQFHVQMIQNSSQSNTTSSGDGNCTIPV